MPRELEDELREAFRMEAEENLQLLATGLLTLEEEGASAFPGTIETIFRAAHSLKGAARAVANWPLEEAAGAWETVLSDWKQSGKLPAEPPFDLLQEMLSLAGPLVEDPAADQAATLEAAVRQLYQSESPAKPFPNLARSATAEKEATPKPAAAGSASAPSPPPKPPVAIKEEKPQPREATVRISHKRLNELVILADEASAVKISARHQALALRSLSDSLERIRNRLDRAQDAPDSSASVLLDHFHDELRQIVRQADEHVRESGRAIDGVRERAQAAFLRPARSLLEIFPKTVRDLSHSQKKRVELSMSGGHLPVDHRVLEGLADPLMHLVRNAIDHGIESPEERTRLGKPEKGCLRILVSQPHPGRIELMIEDDGAGLPLDRIRERAVAEKLLTPAAAEEATAETLTTLIFESGFSTRHNVSAISGRGLGLAIVREKIERLGGHVSVQTKAGKGSRFLITLPSTMVVFRGLSLVVAAQTFVLPEGQVEAVVSFGPDQLAGTRETKTLRHGGEPLPLIDLATVLQLPTAPKAKDDALQQAVIVRSAGERAALVVDEILREDDFPIRPFVRPLIQVKGILGAAILPGGDPLPVLQVSDLLESAFNWVTPAQTSAAAEKSERPEAGEKTILVADDSITSRALLKNILEAAGYKVALAVDGRDAFSALRLQPVDLVVSDVEMPRMDGFQLTEAIRKDPKLANLPVILVTALANAEDREKGLACGANHYIVKTDFEQGHLLETVQRFL